jgi:hypothetical protein
MDKTRFITEKARFLRAIAHILTERDNSERWLCHYQTAFFIFFMIGFSSDI